MSPDVVDGVIALYRRRYAGRRLRIRFFGGEPLLQFPLLRSIVLRMEADPAGKPEFSFPTNGTLLTPEVIAFLERRPDIEVAVSRICSLPSLRRLPNLLVNVCIPPGGGDQVAGYVSQLLRWGFTRLNLLPACFVPWRPQELVALEKGLRTTEVLLGRWADRGRPVEVRNLATLNPTPLFNHGLVVDVNGEVFPSNAFLASPLRSLRARYCLGNVRDPDRLDWERAREIPWDDLFREHMPAATYASTRKVDGLLTGFVDGLRTRLARIGGIPAAHA